jgi:hypothetical protein
MRPALFTLALAILLPAALHAQQPSLTKLWETDTVVAVPESVLPDPANNTTVAGSPASTRPKVWVAMAIGSMSPISAAS